MPNYQTTGAAPALFRSDTAFAFNVESPTPPQASQQFALAKAYSSGDPGSVGVDIRYAAAPSSVQLDIQTAIDDADANYNTVYSSTKTGGEHINIVNLKGRFVRARLTSQTGGGAVTVEFLG